MVAVQIRERDTQMVDRILCDNRDIDISSESDILNNDLESSFIHGLTLALMMTVVEVFSAGNSHSPHVPQ